MEAKASKSALTWVVMTVTFLFLAVFIPLGTVVVRETLVHSFTNIVTVTGFIIETAEFAASGLSEL
jgi:hypothetical protein